MVRPVFFPCFLPLCFFVCSPGRGQEVQDEVIVTARSLREEESRPLPLAVLPGGKSGQEVLHFVPNAFVGSAPGSAFSLRGLTQDGVPSLGTRSNSVINVMVGGMPRSTNVLWAAGLPTWDMRALEIERGPVLFGDGGVSKGGELRLEPNAPVFFHQGRLTGEIGEFDSYRVGLTENAVLVPDQLALRLNAFSDGTDGSVRNVTLDDDAFEAVQRDLLRGQLRWRPGGDERSVFDLLVETEQIQGNPMGLSPTAAGRPFERETAVNTREEMPAERYAASLRGRVELAEGRWIEGELAYQDAEGRQLSDFDGGPLLNWFYRVNVDERRWTGGLRWKEERERLSWTLGLYAETADYASEFTGVGLGPVPSGSPFRSAVGETVEVAAWFAKAEYEWSPGMWLLGGVRLDHQARKQTSDAVIAGFPRGASDLKVSSTEALPEIGVEWRGADAKAGVKLSRAYRPAAAAYAPTFGISEPYGAERGWEANLYGAKQWANWRTEARLFYAKMNGQQVPYIPAGGSSILDQLITNAGKSTRAGVEVEAEWRGPGSFLAGVSGGYLFTEFDRLEINGADRSGQAFPSAPEWNASLRLAWSPPAGWFGETALTWSDNAYSQLSYPDTTGLEKRLLLSARAGYRWKQAELYVFGTNLLNEDFALSRLDYSTVYGPTRAAYGKPNLPRLVGAGFSFTW